MRSNTDIGDEPLRSREWVAAMNPCQWLIRKRHPLPVTRSRCAWCISTAALLAVLLPAIVRADAAPPVEVTTTDTSAAAGETPAAHSGMTRLEDVLGEAVDPLAPIER